MIAEQAAVDLNPPSPAQTGQDKPEGSHGEASATGINEGTPLTPLATFAVTPESLDWDDAEAIIEETPFPTAVWDDVIIIDSSNVRSPLSSAASNLGLKLDELNNIAANDNQCNVHGHHAGCKGLNDVFKETVLQTTVDSASTVFEGDNSPWESDSDTEIVVTATVDVEKDFLGDTNIIVTDLECPRIRGDGALTIGLEHANDLHKLGYGLSIFILIIASIILLCKRYFRRARAGGRQRRSSASSRGTLQKLYDYVYHEEIVLDRLRSIAKEKTINHACLQELLYIAALVRREVRQNQLQEKQRSQQESYEGLGTMEMMTQSISDLIFRYMKEVASESSDVEADYDRLHRDYDEVNRICGIVSSVRTELDRCLDRYLACTPISTAMQYLQRGMKTQDIDGVLFGLALFDECTKRLLDGEKAPPNIMAVYSDAKRYAEEHLHSQIRTDQINTKTRLAQFCLVIGGRTPETDVIIDSMFSVCSNSFVKLLTDDPMPSTAPDSCSQLLDQLDVSTRSPTTTNNNGMPLQVAPSQALVPIPMQSQQSIQIMNMSANEIVHCNNRSHALVLARQQRLEQLRSEARSNIAEQNERRIKQENFRKSLSVQAHQSELYNQRWLQRRRHEVQLRIVQLLTSRRSFEVLWFTFIGVCGSFTFVGMSSYCYHGSWSFQSFVIDQCRSFCLHLDDQPSTGIHPSGDSAISTYIRETLGFDPGASSNTDSASGYEYGYMLSSWQAIGNVFYAFSPVALSSVLQYYWSMWLHKWDLSELWVGTELFMCMIKLVPKIASTVLFAMLLRWLPWVRFWTAEFTVVLLVHSIGQPIMILLEPLKPISILLMVHLALSGYLHYFDRKLSWKVDVSMLWDKLTSTGSSTGSKQTVVRVCDVRYAIVYFLYPMVILGITSSVACVFFKGT